MFSLCGIEMKHGIILFCHGARDPSWVEPFNRIASKLRAACNSTELISLAFLELMSPSLEKAVLAYSTEYCKRITIIPVFFGQGGHLKKDLPKLIDKCRTEHQDIEIFCSMAVGQDDSVVTAIAKYCLNQIYR
ncbi:MAG: CbiX/SirB N-terminal domain-containing protein [Burkholderia sp.]|nr:CbiX/SirB N-terminal domain-containing protein [Burkholderia sp.]